MKELKLWYYRNFCVLSIEKCRSLNLIPFYNVYGDEINKLNCRSVWSDVDFKHIYRCKYLFEN